MLPCYSMSWSTPITFESEPLQPLSEPQQQPHRYLLNSKEIKPAVAPNVLPCYGSEPWNAPMLFASEPLPMPQALANPQPNQQKNFPSSKVKPAETSNILSCCGATPWSSPMILADEQQALAKPQKKQQKNFHQTKAKPAATAEPSQTMPSFISTPWHPPMIFASEPLTTPQMAPQAVAKAQPKPQKSFPKTKVTHAAPTTLPSMLPCFSAPFNPPMIFASEPLPMPLSAPQVAQQKKPIKKTATKQPKSKYAQKTQATKKTPEEETSPSTYNNWHESICPYAPNAMSFPYMNMSLAPPMSGHSDILMHPQPAISSQCFNYGFVPQGNDTGAWNGYAMFADVVNKPFAFGMSPTD